MDTSCRSSSLRVGITERGIIARPRWTRFYYRLLKSPLLFRNTIRQFNGGKMTRRTGYIQTSTFIISHTYAVMQVWRSTHAIYTMNGGRDKTRARQRAMTVYLLCTHLTVLLIGLAPHLSHKETRKNPIKDEGVDWTSRGLYNMEL